MYLARYTPIYVLYFHAVESYRTLKISADLRGFKSHAMEPIPGISYVNAGGCTEPMVMDATCTVAY